MTITLRLLLDYRDGDLTSHVFVKRIRIRALWNTFKETIDTLNYGSRVSDRMLLMEKHGIMDFMADWVDKPTSHIAFDCSLGKVRKLKRQGWIYSESW